MVYTAALKNCANISPNKTFKKRLLRFLRTSRDLGGSFGVADLGEGLLLNLDAIAGANGPVLVATWRQRVNI